MNDQAELRIRFDPDTDGTGKLFAFARSSGFSGCGSAWFSIEGIGRFTQAMTHFPLRHDDLPELAGG